jgi:hypothetical protein
VFEWAAWYSRWHPDIELLYAVPNGQYRPGQRKEPGMKAGVPDMCLPVARGEYHGLYIELKLSDNTPTPKQKQWLAQLREQGYHAVVCYGIDDTTETLKKYLRGESRGES